MSAGSASPTAANRSAGQPRDHGPRQTAVGQYRRRLLAVLVGQDEPRPVRDRSRPHQPDDLEVTEHLGLVVDVADPAVQRWRVRRAQPGGQPRAQLRHERVGGTPTSVQLQREVEAFGAQRGQEPRPVARRFAGCRLTQPRNWRQDGHAVHRTRPSGEEAGVPRRTDERDLGGRVRRPERLERRKREDVVPHRVRAQDRHPFDVGLRHV
jgi:hypothetical protein